MKYLFSIVAIFSSVMACFSQAPKVIPPSPNAMAFQRYGDIPVSTYTGIPSVSVPLYEVKSGDISFPIDLSYHASGIRVADEASKVGLGWVINTGGMISRSIVGGDDFTSNNPGFSPYHTTNSSIPELLQYPSADYGQYFNNQHACVLNFFPSTEHFQDYDGEPDQYYYSLPNGKSGKFILKRNKQVILEKDELIEIKVLDNEAKKWTIRTPDGFIYEFGTYEEYYGGSAPLHKTAWYLTKMTSLTGTTISFNYTTLDYVNNYVKTVGSFYQVMSAGGSNFDNFYNIVPCDAIPLVNAPVPGRQYTNVQIDNIDFDEGYVKFLYDEREDLQNDKKLYKLEIYKKLTKTPLTAERLKAIDFSYEYFQGDADKIEGVRTAFESKRLKLKRVHDKSKTDQKGFNYTRPVCESVSDVILKGVSTPFNLHLLGEPYT